MTVWCVELGTQYPVTGTLIRSDEPEMLWKINVEVFFLPRRIAVEWETGLISLTISRQSTVYSRFPQAFQADVRVVEYS